MKCLIIFPSYLDDVYDLYVRLLALCLFMCLGGRLLHLSRGLTLAALSALNCLAAALVALNALNTLAAVLAILSAWAALAATLAELPHLTPAQLQLLMQGDLPLCLQSESYLQS